MVERLQQSLSSLYEEDETAWLEVMAGLAAQKRFEDMDCENLSEYLESMARRDRREVLNRLIVLLAHVLKWDYQKEGRSKSWRRTMRVQRRNLKQLVESGSLRRYAAEVLPKAYREAVEQATDETGLPPKTFAKQCPITLDELLAKRLST